MTVAGDAPEAAQWNAQRTTQADGERLLAAAICDRSTNQSIKGFFPFAGGSSH